MHISSKNVPRPVAVIADMLSETTGLWKVTIERTKILRINRQRVKESSRLIVDEMLDHADRGEKFWQCRAEYMRVLREMSLVHQRPQDKDLKKILSDIRSGASMDGVLHKVWVKSAIGLIERMIQHESLESESSPAGFEL